MSARRHFCPQWTSEKLGSGYNTPVLKDGLLFGLSNQGNFYCINAKTGETAWTDPTKRENFGGIVDAGRVLLALPSSSELIVFKPDDKEYAEIAKYKVADKQVYAHPIVSGKRVFVRDQDSVALWTIE